MRAQHCRLWQMIACNTFVKLLQLFALYFVVLALSSEPYDLGIIFGAIEAFDEFDSRDSIQKRIQGMLYIRENGSLMRRLPVHGWHPGSAIEEPPISRDRLQCAPTSLCSHLVLGIFKSSCAVQHIPTPSKILFIFKILGIHCGLTSNNPYGPVGRDGYTEISRLCIPDFASAF